MTEPAAAWREAPHPQATRRANYLQTHHQLQKYGLETSTLNLSRCTSAIPAVQPPTPGSP